MHLAGHLRLPALFLVHDMMLRFSNRRRIDALWVRGTEVGTGIVHTVPQSAVQHQRTGSRCVFAYSESGGALFHVRSSY
jgi:hypothetical protein